MNLFLFLNIAFIIAIINILFYARIPHFLLPNIFGRKWVSNIVGNPYALDRLFTLFLGPFPEQNDFNAVLANLDLSKAIVFHGRIPLARYWGFQLFLVGARKNLTEQTLADHEIIPDEDTKPLNIDYSNHAVQRSSKSYTLVVSSKECKPAWAKNWVDIGSSHPRNPKEKMAHLAFRGYCPYFGAPFATPDCFIVEPNVLSSYSTTQDFLIAHLGAEERIGQKERVFSPWATVSHRGSERNRLGETLLLDAAILILLSPWIQDPLEISLLFVMSTLISWFIYQKVMYGLASKRYKDLLRRGYPREIEALEFKTDARNKSIIFPDPHGSLAGHPNHQYYTIPYDASETDVEIRGFITGPFRYTSIQCYTWDSIPIPDFLYDKTLYPDTPDDQTEQKDSRYTIRLTSKPSYHPQQNIINVSAAPQGICLVRLIYPENEEVIKKYAPTVRPIPRLTA